MPDNAAFTCAAINEHRFIRLGWLILLGGLGSFLLWAIFAPLDKGVISPGTVIVDGYRKAIQSPVNGVVTRIMVKEGQQVHKDEMLVQLSQTSILAQQAAARERYITARITEHRLQAELADESTITPLNLADSRDFAEISQTILYQQKQLMQARREALKKELDGYAQSVAGLTRQRASLIQTRHKKETGQRLLNRQLKDLQPLTEEGYYPRNRYLELRQQAASLASDISETKSRIVQIENQIEQTGRNIQQRLAENRKDIETQLEQVRQQLSESNKQLMLLDLDLTQTQIIAPQDGVIMSLALTNVGAVVSLGQQLMELVPHTPLIVEARLDVSLIDRVHEGLPVTLMFTAFNQHQTPKVSGNVTLISADRQTDPTTRQPYYKIQIAVSQEGMHLLKKEKIKPGMPVEVFIKTGERSLLNYLLKPVMDRASQSFIEE